MAIADTTEASRTAADDEVTAPRLFAVHSCSRLGRSANPPGLPLPPWLRRRR